MSGNCTAFATKPEVEVVASQVRLKVDKTEVSKIQEASVAQSVGIAQQLISSIGQVVTAKIAANTYLTSQAITKVNSVVKTAGEANSIALKAASAAKNAKFEALYAQTRASAAKAAAAKNASSIGSVLGKVGGAISIVSTMATVAALAALQQQVLDISRRVKVNKQINQENKRRIKKLEFAAKVATAQAKKAAAEREAIELGQKRLQKRIDNFYHALEQSNQRNQEINQRQQAYFADLEKQIAAANNAVQKNQQNLNKKIETTKVDIQNSSQQLRTGTTQKINLELLIKKIDALEDTIKKQRNANIEQKKKIDKLKNPDQLITRVRNLDDKVTNYNKDLFKIGDKTIELESSFVKEKREGYVRAQAAIKQVEQIKKKQIEDVKRGEYKVARTESKINKVQQKQVDEINQKLITTSRKVEGVDSKVSKLPGATEIALGKSKK